MFVFQGDWTGQNFYSRDQILEMLGIVWIIVIAAKMGENHGHTHTHTAVQVMGQVEGRRGNLHRYHFN